MSGTQHPVSSLSTSTRLPRRAVAEALLVGLAVALAGCDSTAPTEPMQAAQTDVAQLRVPVATVEPFATGLDNPRGLEFGPDGNLYVAEGGTGGTGSTEGQCDQVIAPVGPYTSGYTARISMIDPDGNRTTVVDNLPSSQTSPALGSLVSGVGDVAFIGNQLYAVKNAEEEDFEPDGTWYSLIAVRGDLYAVEPNHGEVDKITLHGNSAQVSRLVDVSATQGHIVPTAIAYHGNFYFGNLTTFPLVPGAASIYQLNPAGVLPRHFGHLTSVLGIAFDHQGRLYALENTVCPTDEPCEPTPGTGAVVMVRPDGTTATIASGLMFPTGMTMGPDGALYVSVNGFGFPEGAGGVVKVSLSD
jgi:glucose/arabinose dehydrogenase